MPDLLSGFKVLGKEVVLVDEVTGVPLDMSAMVAGTGGAAAAAQLPAALAAGGGLKVEGVAGGVAQPVSMAAVSSGALMALVPNSTQADQRLTVDATAGGVQFGALHADTLWVFWSCEDAQCRVTFDSSAPTSSNGHIINPGDSGVWAKALATAAKFIRTGATSAVLHASQMK